MQGPKIFRQHCAACHDHVGGSADSAQDIHAEKASAANLWGIGTRDWLRGILDPNQIGGPHYFGNTAFKDGDMVKFVKEKIGDKLNELKGNDLTAFRSEIEDVEFALLTEANQPIDHLDDVDKHVANGRKAMVDVFACIDCHKFRKEGDIGMAPDLTGYASREWLTAFISNPADERFYRDTNDRMPAFAPHPNDPANRLSPEDLATLVSWLRGEWYEPPIKANLPGVAATK
jgi:ubiquinol-cytochrome c reductase cytochrome b subunit